MVPAIEALHDRFDIPLSCRHLEGRRWPRGLPGRGGGRQRHQRIRRPGVPARGRARRARRWWPPTSGSARGCLTPSPSTTTWSTRSADSWPTRGAGRGRRHPGASGSWSTPASISARPSRSRSSCCGAPTDSPALGYPVFLSASNKRFLGHLLGTDVTDSPGGDPRGPRPRHRARLPRCCGPTTCGAPGGSADVMAAILEARATMTSDRRAGVPREGRRRRAAGRRVSAAGRRLVGDRGPRSAGRRVRRSTTSTSARPSTRPRRPRSSPTADCGGPPCRPLSEGRRAWRGLLAYLDDSAAHDRRWCSSGSWRPTAARLPAVPAS